MRINRWETHLKPEKFRMFRGDRLNQKTGYTSRGCRFLESFAKWNFHQMKNDPRSYERNLCNCVKKPEKNSREHMGFFHGPPNVSGFIAQLVRASHRHREVTGSNPVDVLNFFFSGFFTQLHKFAFTATIISSFSIFNLLLLLLLLLLLFKLQI